MKLETERLIILPLTVPQLELWIADIPALEKELDCWYEGEVITDVFQNIVRGQISKCIDDIDNLMYHTFCFIILKDERKVVGAIDFKDIPNELGEVEIGYGLGPNHIKNGYMTEAVLAMKSWAFQQPLITALIAETENDNAGSQSVLLRCGFHLTSSDETLWWKLCK